MQLPVDAEAAQTSARYAFSPQLRSCSRSPESRPVTRLKMREGIRLVSGSRRFAFQPETRSNPSSSFASRRGISAGSSCRSPSIVTTRSPCASSNPAASAVALPKFVAAARRAHSSSRACSRVSAANVRRSSRRRRRRPPSAVRAGRAPLAAPRGGARCFAPRRAGARRPRSRPLAYVPDERPADDRGGARGGCSRAPPRSSRSGAARRRRGPRSRRGARAAVDLPPFASSAMDGYALRAGHARDAARRRPDRRRAAGRARARAGEAMAIATGGVVPEGADASFRSRTLSK